MPTFEFTSPEGKTYTVNGPDGATKEQAFQILQSQLGGKQAPSAPVQAPNPYNGKTYTYVDETAGANQSDAPSAQPKQERGIGAEVAQGVGNLVAGAVRGAGSIGATLLSPIDIIKDALDGKGLSLESNRQRRAAIDAGLQTLGAEPDSLTYKGGKILGELAGTGGVGSALAKGAVMAAPRLAASPVGAKLVEAIASNGFRTGAPAAANLAGKAADLGIRTAGGAITGAASAGLVSPDDATTGAVVGGLMPPVIAGIGAAGRYAGNGAKSLIQPFTEKGQDEIAQNVIRRFAQGGPTALNTSEIVPGSVPTLAEATGNAGLATLQRGTRDLRPNAFVERETQNAAARNALFDQVAGDAGKLDFFRASRKQAATDLYQNALDSANQNPTTPWIKGQITQLLKAPSINDARMEAQRLAQDRLEKPSPAGSLRAMHDMKTILDDKISEAVRKGKGGEAEALGSLQNKLLNVMDKLSNDYAEARATYAEMSKPIDQMEVLQGLNLRDAQGNITLAKTQNAIRSLQSQIDAPGVNPAKSLTKEQMGTLTSIRDDLLRQANLGAGSSVKSNTFQNLATDNILNSFLGNGLSRLADKTGISGLVGQAGKLAYSGPNEAIRNRLVDMMLQPKLAAPGLLDVAPVETQGLLTGILSDPRLQQPLYRFGPVSASDR